MVHHGMLNRFWRALAEAVLADGHNAAITARQPEQLADLEERYSGRVLALALDVTVRDQIGAAARATLERFGWVDVVVNNAGYGYRAAVEEATPEEIQRLFATNFHGPVDVMKAFLPAMRERRAGKDREYFVDGRADALSGLGLLRCYQGGVGGGDGIACQAKSPHWGSRR